MTNVLVEYHHGDVQKIKVQGHSGFADKGEDIVCAGVSSVVIGAMNAMDILVHNQVSFEMDEADIEIKVLESSERMQTILQVLIIQLESIAEAYSKFVRLEKEEV